MYIAITGFVTTGVAITDFTMGANGFIIVFAIVAATGPD